MYRLVATWLAFALAALALAVAQNLLFGSPPAVGVLLAMALPAAAVPLARYLVAPRSRRSAGQRAGRIMST